MGDGDWSRPIDDGAHARRGGRGRRALLVEHEPDVRLVLSLMLADELGPGLLLELAEDGHQALQLIDSSTPPDIAIIGLDLPQRAGVEVVRRIRARGGLGLIVVFSTLAMIDPDGVQAALDAGADVVVPKPDVARLRDVLRRAPVLSERRLQ